MNSFICHEFRILLGLGAVAVEPTLLYQPAVFGTLSANSCEDRKDICQIWTGDWPLPPTPQGHLQTAGIPKHCLEPRAPLEAAASWPCHQL